MNVNGDPYVVEFNVRLGDPETQVVIPRLNSDLLEIFNAVTAGKINNLQVEFSRKTACTVVMASEGYPGRYEKGKEITNLDRVGDCIVFHAGTKKLGNKLVTSGGRVLAVTSTGSGMKEALSNCYLGTEAVHFEGKYFRRDIGFDL
jgi:phosphoribosylamine--glycine ligase